MIQKVFSLCVSAKVTNFHSSKSHVASYLTEEIENKCTINAPLTKTNQCAVIVSFQGTLCNILQPSTNKQAVLKALSD